jgi:hypothetical protein
MTMINRSIARFVVLSGLFVSLGLAGCEYGYSRSALIVESGYPAASVSRGYRGYAYDPYYAASPGYVSYGFSLSYGYPYAYPGPYIAPYWYYASPFYFPYYYRPYVFVPSNVGPPPRRTFRSGSGISSPKPDAPASSRSRRQFNLP